MDSNQADMMKPAKMADTYYYGVKPTICKVAADMDDMSVAYPTQGMYDSMLDRAYDEVTKMYPDEMPGQAQTGYHAEQFFGPFRRRPFVRDLLGALLFNELLERRRRFFW